jgi:hypothetical protein
MLKNNRNRVRPLQVQGQNARVVGEFNAVTSGDESWDRP